MLKQKREQALALQILVFLSFVLLTGCSSAPREKTKSESASPTSGGGHFVGRVSENRAEVTSKPRPVRNDVAQKGEEVVTLRYWKIKKGTFPEFYRLSAEEVWPFFEKIGARVIGAWQVVAPEGIDDDALKPHADYDEVYMATRYASVKHWQASRDMARLGGNGPDWEKCSRAIEARRAMTIETHIVFLRGHMAPGGPYFLPGLGEEYQPAAAEKKN